MQPTVENTPHGAILYDDRLVAAPSDRLFDPEHWRSKDAVLGAVTGRGTAWIVQGDKSPWVLRHFQRGGWFSAVNKDTYLWIGEPRARPFLEWRLLFQLRGLDLPVPAPVAARYTRSGLVYRADLITVYLEDTVSLAQKCDQGHVDESLWSAVGSTLRDFHDRGVDHADLNANNILIDEQQQVYLVDFDRGRLRSPGAWARRNLSRLERSLRKVATMRGGAFPAVGWRALNEGYAR